MEQILIGLAIGLMIGLTACALGLTWWAKRIPQRRATDVPLVDITQPMSPVAPRKRFEKHTTKRLTFANGEVLDVEAPLGLTDVEAQAYMPDVRLQAVQDIVEITRVYKD